MHSTILHSGLMFVAWMLPASLAIPDTVQVAPEVGIPAIWAELDEQWNDRNAQRFSEVFTADASVHFVDAGLELESSETILQHFSKQFPTFPPGLRHETSVTQIRPLEEGLHAVDARVRILRGTGGNEGDSTLRTFSVFAVMLDTPKGWRIHLLRAYRLPDGPQPAAARNTVSRPSIR